MPDPVAYYHPEFIESRPNDPCVPPPLPASETASKSFEQLAQQRTLPVNLPVDVDITQAMHKPMIPVTNLDDNLELHVISKDLSDRASEALTPSIGNVLYRYMKNEVSYTDK